MQKVNVAAFDLGASSGRLVLGEFDGARIKLYEIHRFDNEPVRMSGRFYWDVFRLFHEMKVGLRKLAAQRRQPDSLGIDTWGVDYGLLDRQGNLIGLPIHYRDGRTSESVNDVLKVISAEELYDITGIQFMDINTVFQLHSDKIMRSDILDKAADFLMMPDLFGFFMTGEKYNEYTELSTSQLMDARKKVLDERLLSRIGIRKELFCPLVEPGTVVGVLNEETMRETGMGKVKVVAVGSHDTASAVAGTPFMEENSVFLSCGTWSLLGIELQEPMISRDIMEANFTNEGGVENTIRFLKNINGLYIIQQLKKNYSDKYGTISYQDIISATERSSEKGYRIDPNDSLFSAPIDMMEAITEYCRQNGQGEPKGLGELAMAVYNGLTTEYKATVDTLERLTRKTVSCIHMVGGGIQDELLCRQTAAATGKKIIAGPIEASVLGNMLMQLKAVGMIKNLEEGREIIRASFELKCY